MANLLSAIISIIQSQNINYYHSNNIKNRINAMGAFLEDYIKNAFASCIGESQTIVDMKRSSVFSYLGGMNTPPDAILKNGDAIEIKKIESKSTQQLQLNSSYPKNKLYSSDLKISKECRECEKNWKEKDMLYVIGQVNKSQIKSIFFVSGDLYCDDCGIYQGLLDKIKNGISLIPSVTLSKTNELARINKVDHLGITSLRIRGMWLITSPYIYFDKYLEFSEKDRKLIALIPEYKYNSYLETCPDFYSSIEKLNISLRDLKIPNPKNPAILVNSKLISAL